MGKQYAIIGYACDKGGLVRGSHRAPSVLRSNNLTTLFAPLGHNVDDFGDVIDWDEDYQHALPFFTQGELDSKQGKEVYQACAALRQRTEEAYRHSLTPIIIGGDHSLSMGSVAAISNVHAERSESVGLIWVDAHGDINTPETSPSGNFFGMSVAYLTGVAQGAFTALQCSPPAIKLENLAYIGLRSLDPGEKRLISSRKINAFTMKEIDILGMAAVTNEAISIASKNTAGFVVSFDLDVCDPHLAPATGTPQRGGLTFREAHLLLELLYDSGRMLSFELVEFNPALDKDFVTGELALSLIESSIGKSIL